MPEMIDDFCESRFLASSLSTVRPDQNVCLCWFRPCTLSTECYCYGMFPFQTGTARIVGVRGAIHGRGEVHALVLIHGVAASTNGSSKALEVLTCHVCILLRILCIGILWVLLVLGSERLIGVWCFFVLLFTC